MKTPTLVKVLLSTALVLVALPALMSAQTALTATKSFSSPSILVGGQAVLTIRISNPNADNATGVAISDQLQPEIAYVANTAATTCNGVLTVVAGLVSLTGGSIPANSTCTITLTVQGVIEGIISNATSPVTAVSVGTRGAPPPGAAAVAQLVIGLVYQVRYAANLNIADSLVNITNTGLNGASLTGPGFGPVGNICVNVYAFSPDEQMVACCSCLITPNGLVSLSVYDSLRSNTLTGVTPNSMVIKLVATGAGSDFIGSTCAGSAGVVGSLNAPIAAGAAAWGTTAHIPGAGAVPGAPAPFSITETPFSPATLSVGELASLNNRCTNIIGNGSGFGICRGCAAGGRGAVSK